MFMCISLAVYAVYLRTREKGLIRFMPSPLKTLLLEASFFDLLVNIFIYRHFANFVISVVTPFLNSSNPKEARKLLMLQNLDPELTKILFTKVSSPKLLIL